MFEMFCLLCIFVLLFCLCSLLSILVVYVMNGVMIYNVKVCEMFVMVIIVVVYLMVMNYGDEKVILFGVIVDKVIVGEV